MKDKNILQTLINFMAHCLLLTDSQGNIVLTNQTGQRILQKSDATSIIAQNIFHLFPEALKLSRRRFFEQAISTSNPVTFEDKDQNIVWKNFLYPVYDNGQLIYVCFYSVDVTERRQAKESLEEIENIFNLFLENSPIYIFFKDEKIRSIKLSRNYEKLLGRPMAELLGKNMYELFPSELAKSMVEDDLRIINEGKTVEAEEELYGRIFSTTKFPIIRKGKPNLLAGFTSDITERKRTESMLGEQSLLLRKLSLRLAEVEEAERRRIARELHDQVGQNLTALGINLSILKSMVPVGVAEEIWHRFRDSLELVEQTTAYTRDLMSDLRPPVLDDYGLMAAIKFYTERFSARTGIPIELQGRDIIPRPSTSVEITVFRIIQEACHNISKHAGAKQVRIIGETTENMLRVTVIDDGMGFDPRHLNKTNEKYGWGLLIMAERAAAIGGSFKLESKPGQGTKVIVEAPR